jgi:uncharacterized protein YrrD
VRRASEVVGKAIVSAESGERIGTAADLLLDERRTHLVGIVVSDGWFSPERVLPFAEVQAIGRDVIVTRTSGGILDARQWRDQGMSVARASGLKDKQVITDAGRTVGNVKDVCLDEASGDIDGYEVSGRKRLISHRSVVRVGGDVAVGPDAIVIFDLAVEGPESRSGGEPDAKTS